MNYRSEKIDGIGEANAKNLAAAGIEGTRVLLDGCGSANGRKEVAAATGLTGPQILRLALMRLPCVGEEFSGLLEAADADTVKELKRRKGERLAARMTEEDAEEKLAELLAGVMHG
jgi:hypothetical protein